MVTAKRNSHRPRIMLRCEEGHRFRYPKVVHFVEILDEIDNGCPKDGTEIRLEAICLSSLEQHARRARYGTSQARSCRTVRKTPVSS